MTVLIHLTTASISHFRRAITSLSILTCLCTLTFESHANVTLVIVGNSGTRLFQDASGNPLPPGSRVRIGTFDLSSPENLELIRTSNDFEAINALFTPMGEGEPNAGSPFMSINNSGQLQGSITDISPDYIPIHTTLYMWAWNQSDFTIRPTTQWAIVSSSNWGFPPNNTASSLALSQVTNSPEDILIGTFTEEAIRLAPIQENPSASTGNDFAPANVGQAKWMAKQSITNLNTHFAPIGGAGFTIYSLLDLNGAQNDFAPLSVGQLKYLAQPFYNRLLSIGFNTQDALNQHMPSGAPSWPHTYPWNPESPRSENAAPANLGQLKFVFSPEFWIFTIPDFVDADQDGLNDHWEVAHNLSPFDNGYRDPDQGGQGDPDNDGFTNLEEQQNETDPNFPETPHGIMRRSNVFVTHATRIRGTNNATPTRNPIDLSTLPPPLFEGSITALANHQLIDTRAQWGIIQIHIPNHHYYVHFDSGLVVDIISKAQTTLTLARDVQQNIRTGDRYRIHKHRNINDTLGFDFQAGTNPSNADHSEHQSPHSTHHAYLSEQELRWVDSFQPNNPTPLVYPERSIIVNRTTAGDSIHYEQGIPIEAPIHFQ